MNDRSDQPVTGEEFADATTSDADPALDAGSDEEAVEQETSEEETSEEETAESSVEQDLNDLVEDARSQRDEYLELAQRTKADFDNYRKRMTAETAAARAKGRLEMASGLIEAIDNLERVLAAEEVDLPVALDGEIPTEAPVGLQGVIVAYRDLNGTLKRVGIEVSDPTGETFDPTFHEALQAIPSEEVESGRVLEVMQRGYRSEETVIRPARVVVSQ